jgi:methylmalonyl-CoA/ethylmalonyl-CoA epimerase
MAKATFDHVALLVRDLDEAIEDYKTILSVLDPKQITEVVRDEATVEGARVRWATFVKGEGGMALQLIESEVPRDRQLLSRRGECVHHIAFCSSNVEETTAQLSESGIPVMHKVAPHAPDRPWLRWNFVAPGDAHGVLIEISQQYSVRDGKWVEPE